ncbi:MAG TPA: response regulator transcription factor [Candidatus Krumholzibacteria bacterium]|nr:response regulator transcription factor [Candidatus Krumholzibacteria bacterium]
MTRRVLIVLARKVCRQGLRHFLCSLPNLVVLGEAADGREAVSQARELRPDVAILETNLPELNGIDAIAQITEQCPETAVIAVSVHADMPLVTRALGAGARAFVLTDGGVGEIALALDALSDNHVYLSPEIEDRVVTSFDHISTVPSGVLSPREREVIQLLAEGKSTREIAGILTVSVKTVETHRHNIMLKLGIHSIAKLTKYAIRNGITSLN